MRKKLPGYGQAKYTLECTKGLLACAVLNDHYKDQLQAYREVNGQDLT